MKRIIYLLSCVPFFAFAQSDLFSSPAIANGATIMMDARDITGKIIPTSAQRDVEGNPMLAGQFVDGVVKFKGGEKTYNLMVNLSLFDNQLYFKKENTTLKFVNALDNFSLILKENNATKIMNFNNGFPSIGNNNEETFYQVLLDGTKVKLLKYLSKSIREKYSYGGPVVREYVEKNSLYAYDVATKSITEITPSTNTVEKALPNYTALIEKFAIQKKLKHEEDLIALLTTINNEPSKKELKATK